MFKKFLSAMLAVSMLLALGITAGAAKDEMLFSDEIVEFLKEKEGFEADAYRDGSGWSIGYGTVCEEDEYPDGISKRDAEERLLEELQEYADEINTFLDKNGATVSQSEFDALCSLTYNIGPVWMTGDYVIKEIVLNGAKNYTDAEVVSAFAVCCHVDGEVYETLIPRRIAEAKIFLYSDYEDDSGAEFVYLILDADGGKLERDVLCFQKGAAYGTLPNAEKAGYVLSGWRTQSGTMLTEQDAASKNLTVTAVWAEEGAARLPDVFPDVKGTDWFYTYISELASKGVINGFEDGYFYPYSNVTYAQALKLILLASGYSSQESTDGEHWAKGYLDYAVTKGFVADGAITDLDAAINRNEIAAIAAKALELTGSGAQSAFYDTDNKNVSALFEAGIIEGSVENGQRLYKGENDITRAEISAIISRISGYVEENLILFASHRLKIDKTLTRHIHDDSLLYWKDGRVKYSGNTEALTGIDVSYYQGDIDWTAVAADGIDFAFIRVGYRGYGEGTLNEDECFKKNISGAIAAGIEVGIYFFSQAITEAEAIEEARYVLSLIDGYDVTWPVVFDWETIGSASARTDNLDGQSLTKCAVAFCEAVKNAGYTPMVYFNKTLGYLKYDMSQIQQYELWYAYYHEAPDFIYDYQIWQYGAGAVKGISGQVDLNIAFKDYS